MAAVCVGLNEWFDLVFGNMEVPDALSHASILPEMSGDAACHDARELRGVRDGIAAVAGSGGGAVAEFSDGQGNVLRNGVPELSVSGRCGGRRLRRGE